jgi:REP element-mobilizing transposase RayT
MSESGKASHAVYDIKYHIIWVTKYRYKILGGNVFRGNGGLTHEMSLLRE